jgi:hypothetical protein
MKMLSVFAAAMILMASCNNSKKEKSGEEIVDTSQKATNTTKTIDETPQKITDTSGKATDNTKKEDKTADTTAGATMKWTKLGSGGQSSMNDRSLLLISNKAKFDELWKIAFANGIAPQKPNVDFTKNSVVILFLGEVTSSGHRIELLSIRSSIGGEFEISAQHTKPGSSCVTASVMEHPYFFALTDKPISGKPNLRINTKETKCE